MTRGGGARGWRPHRAQAREDGRRHPGKAGGTIKDGVGLGDEQRDGGRVAD
jgi:hypothetical protein